MKLKNEIEPVIENYRPTGVILEFNCSVRYIRKRAFIELASLKHLKTRTFV